MQCLILAGGLGTRMRAFGGGTPKALLPAGPHTFIDWQLQFLEVLGVKKVVMALGHDGQTIEKHIENHRRTLAYPSLTYSYDSRDSKLLGTGGAIKNASKLLDKEFLVIYGDSFLFIKLDDFERTHRQGGLPLTLSIFKNRDQGDKSNVVFKNGSLLKYDKKRPDPEMEYIDYGLSFLNRDYFLRHTPDGIFDFADFISETVEKKLATPYVAKTMFHEVGSPEGYSRFLDLLKENNFSLEKLKLSVQ